MSAEISNSPKQPAAPLNGAVQAVAAEMERTRRRREDAKRRRFNPKRSRKTLL